ncbi:MAG: response regulator [Fibrobacteres bacterium]|nr:response regulator [Fibrobacterota bacterium]
MQGKMPHVLVVDDEPALRRLMADVLRMNGYAVLTAAHALEALELSAGEAGPPDLLVTDVMMPPHCDGLELARLMRRGNPGLKVLYVSAYAGDPLVALACGDPLGEFLPKPLSPLVLSQRVEAILRGTPFAGRRDACRTRGTVLLRVADPYRRHWIRESLRESGYWVLDTAHGSEALFIGRWHEGPIHLILADPPGSAERTFWASTLSGYRPGLDLLFVEEDRDGIRLRPAREPESIPVLWEDVKGILARTAV